MQYNISQQLVWDLVRVLQFCLVDLGIGLFFQQVHLTQGDYLGKAVIVTWITEQTAAPIVYYGTQNGSYVDSQTGNTTQYTFYNYTSGFIHIVTLSDLEVCDQLFALVAHIILMPNYYTYIYITSKWNETITV
jgi:hypothetical protein